jgi:hypothetical protein
MKKNIYRVYFPRTGDWYNNEGKWYQLSTWLDDTIGYDWDYVDEHFEFSDESHKLWFMLRWQ